MRWEWKVDRIGPGGALTMAENALVTMLGEVRGKTLRVLGGVGPEQARWTPPGLQNSILWHAGHCYIVVERLTAGALGRAPVEPDGWFEIFSWESRPATVAAERWPSLGAVVARLEEQAARLRGLYASLTDEDLARAPASGTRATAQATIIHGLHDEACHCGEVMLLRKLQGMTRG